MTAGTLGDRVIGWAQAEPSVELLVLIGSQARPAGNVAAADRFSDWDFQIGTSRPELFSSGAWTAELGLRVIAYVNRAGRLGSAQKVSALFAEGELDLVLIPTASLRAIAAATTGLPLPDDPAMVRALTDLSAVLQGGYRIIKGADEFSQLYDLVARRVPPARLSDQAVRQLADGFVYDFVSTLRKIDRAELIAAQRWLHHQLAETNFRLLHELRQREGQLTFPDARRLEMIGAARLSEMTVNASLEPASLRAAAWKSAATCRTLVGALLGDAWRWPDLSSLGVSAE